MHNLKITLIQTDIIWENVPENLSRYETEYLSNLKPGETDLVLFPELFTTGFTMNTVQFCQKMDGKVIHWMQRWAKKLNTQIGGSIIIKENDKYYNRFAIVSENGIETYYDKNHLFRMGDENNHFTKGNTRVIHTIKGWNILLQVCYDLRFPVFSRNQTIKNNKEYDALIYIANWPEVRSDIWSTLLKARAIENQSYCIGVNRIGKDNTNIAHSGDSVSISPWGKEEKLKSNQENMKTIELSKNELNQIKSKFPAYLDANKFIITDK
jgi:predicted amidohydrolase